MRLDKLLVERGLAQTRSRAQDLIARGQVLVDGVRPLKPGVPVGVQSRIEVLEPRSYVSRGALKLKAALQAFDFSPQGLVALDAGASTGGFTEVLLEGGASRIYAVDVGSGQLHPQLRADPRIVSLEKTDIRILDRSLIGDEVQAITVDVSFISLAKVLPALFALAAEEAWLVALVKPQFEAGPDRVGKGGIVRDKDVREEVVQSVAAFIETANWSVTGMMPSPFPGGSGNEEFLLGARRRS
jgi:23S rRNA (cytidine1920-2'-O)/16S rRNA (cytidine1409-2'-O)-methyltransferase